MSVDPIERIVTPTEDDGIIDIGDISDIFDDTEFEKIVGDVTEGNLDNPSY